MIWGNLILTTITNSYCRMGPKREHGEVDKGGTKKQKTGQSVEEMNARIEALKNQANLKGLKNEQQRPNKESTLNNADDFLAKIRERKAQAQKEKNVRSGKEAATTKERVLSNMDESLRSIRARKEQAQKEKNKATGLNTPVHPLLAKKEATVEEKEKGPVSNKYLQAPESELVAGENPYFDPNVITGKMEQKRKRGLVFNPKGKFIEQGKEMRKQAQLEALKRKVEESSKQVGLGADLVAGEREYKPDRPPTVEWWDEEVINDMDEAVTDLIQHPIPIAAPYEKYMPQNATIHMTKKEYKRLRKNRRAQKHKEEQDRIRLGLDPAPPPKIKPSNVMSVYANEAIKDPTLMEQKAKQAVAERKQKHEEDNQNRKLTPEQRYQKMMEKIERDKSKGLYCAVFRIEKLVDGSHKFKLNYNANKFNFTGMVIFNPNFALVVVEGGHLQVKKFTKLLINRINWTEAAPPRDGSTKPDLSNNQCRLVWHGEIKKNHFQYWSLKDAETEQDAKDLLARHDVQSFWIEARSLDNSITN